MKTKNYSKGFTLVELLLVIAIIAILATVLFVSLGAQRERARVSAFKENARGLVTTFTACADGGGTIYGTTANSELDGETAVCGDGTVAGSNRSGIDANIPKVPSCDGAAGEWATITSSPANGDSWEFVATCPRSDSDYCVMRCSADGCAANENADGADALSSCE